MRIDVTLLGQFAVRVDVRLAEVARADGGVAAAIAALARYYGELLPSRSRAGRRAPKTHRHADRGDWGAASVTSVGWRAPCGASSDSGPAHQSCCA